MGIHGRARIDARRKQNTLKHKERIPERTTDGT
jgi:hypothetical protein